VRRIDTGEGSRDASDKCHFFNRAVHHALQAAHRDHRAYLIAWSHIAVTAPHASSSVKRRRRVVVAMSAVEGRGAVVVAGQHTMPDNDGSRLALAI
jgi:hypothetical protein